MGIGFEIKYHKLVVKEDIPKLTKIWQEKIRISIERKLTSEPQTFGRPLRKSLRGYRRLRVGDYRVVYRIEDMVIKIFVIEHRSRVYMEAAKRL